jgi:hypothetical protein
MDPLANDRQQLGVDAVILLQVADELAAFQLS